MKITKKWLKEKDACQSGFDWWVENGTESVRETVDKLMSANKFDWANWLLTNVFTKDKNVQYAIFAARSVLKIYEDKYLDDLRPRKAIEAAEQYLKTKSKAARAARAAGDAAWAAGDAARDAAGNAAWAAMAAAGAAAWNAAGAAARDAGAAAGAEWAAAGAAAFKKMQEKIINYGLSLLEDA